MKTRLFTLLILIPLLILGCNDNDDETGGSPTGPLPAPSEVVEDPSADAGTVTVPIYMVSATGEGETVDGCDALTLWPVERSIVTQSNRIIESAVAELLSLNADTLGDEVEGLSSSFADADLTVDNVTVEPGGSGESIFVNLSGDPAFPDDTCERAAYEAQLRATVRALVASGDFIYFSFNGETPDWMLQRSQSDVLEE